MIVDAHHHLWTIDGGYTWLDEPGLEPIRRTFTPAMLRAELAATGVRHTVLVEGGRCDRAEAADLLRLAAETPEIAGVVAWLDPAAADVAGTVAAYRALPGGDRLVGVRAQVQSEATDYLDRADVRRGLADLGAAGLVFDLVVRADQLGSAARAARALPQVRFVLDHLGKPRIRAGELDGWSAAIADLAAAPNTYAKLSGLVTEADHDRWTVADLRPYVREAVAAFGPARLMFGSDWPVCLLAATYGEVHAALVEALGPLPEPDRRAIFGETAVAAYGLRDPRTGILP
ncbi:amidohydrolase family protein [Virgisporangium ochraceum]|uniref:Amidohydrolase n=1 Tax=Virgisporangium ochraceum TaxID=65505 RepID=A0A8J4A0H2_9ACTN|nr:amidohydrolase family protein [Virgisporangium ochraceum]GIJ71850.1 amidohydrolase [Virgisporangium ochraceum]